MHRRDFAATTFAAMAVLAGCTRMGAESPVGAEDRDRKALAALRALEMEAGGTLGVFLLDTVSGASVGWRDAERFCHCSSFKLSLAALMWREADAGRIDPREELEYARDDLMSVSPVTTKNLDAETGKGALSMEALAWAIQTTSDNAGANILMRRLGGPEALTDFWRSIGDDVSQLDAYEPELNRIPPGTTENSTTPEAMARTLAKITTGDVLSPTSRTTLRDSMKATVTGLRRLRQGLPGDWWVGDKTGTSLWPGEPSNYIDIALIEPPSASPIVVTSYYVTAAPEDDMSPASESVLAQVGLIAREWAGK